MSQLLRPEGRVSQHSRSRFLSARFFGRLLRRDFATLLARFRKPDRYRLLLARNLLAALSTVQLSMLALMHRFLHLLLSGASIFLSHDVISLREGFQYSSFFESQLARQH